MDLNRSRSTLLLCTLAGLTLRIVPTTGYGQAVPDARAHHQLVDHAGHERAYLIGGSTPRGDGHHYFAETWFWADTAWNRGSPLPFPRSSHRVVYHVERNSLILFGGGFGRAVKAEGVLWEWSDGGWHAVGGNIEAGRDEPGLCYDRERERVVVFGGWDAAVRYRGDTWEWDGRDLVPVDSTGPGPRAGHAFLYDPGRRRCLLFGGRGANGYHADTWEWDGTGWRRLDVAGPSARWFFGSAADPQNQRIVLFGGRGPDGDLADTWEWDGERWEPIGSGGPPARSMARLAYVGRGIILLFGGRTATPAGFRDLNDTWELRGRSWMRRH